MDSTTADPVALAVEIVSAFVARNSLASSELPVLIESVHAALVKMARGPLAPGAPESLKLTPSVAVRKSITSDYLICLDDGRRLKSLRRHLAKLGMTPGEYLAKWKLPADYPMVAPNYSAAQSAMAKKSGHGEPRSANAGVQSVGVLAKPKDSRARRNGRALLGAGPHGENRAIVWEGGDETQGAPSGSLAHVVD